MLVAFAGCRSAGLDSGADGGPDAVGAVVAVSAEAGPPSSPPGSGPSSLETPPPAFDVPAGWSIDCRAAWCASTLETSYEHGDETHMLDEEAIEHQLDRATFACFPEWKEDAPRTCVFEGDFDGDLRADRLTWVLQASTLRFDMLVRWGGSGTSTLVGEGPWGHLHPAPGREGCAASSFQLADWAHQATRPEDVSVRHLRVADDEAPRDVLVLDAGAPRWIWFQDGHWRVARPDVDNRIAPPFAHVDPEAARRDAPTANASACKEARRIRVNAYRDRSAERMLWTKRKDVARDPCSQELDLDGDGAKERVSWVVHRGVTGLRIDWPDGKVSVLGAGRAVPIEVFEGEPGCNAASSSFDETWAVDVAPWTGAAWKLPDGGTQVPFDATRVKGDALALTNMAGHVDLVFYVDDEFRSSAVPFPWHEIRVLMPLQSEWSPVWPPIPEVRRYVRPRPVTRARVQDEESEKPPKRVRFFAGS